MPHDIEDRIAAVRRFSRFYTRRIGLLHEGLLGSTLSLTEGRVIYELGHRKHATATALAAELELDQGYLSRILRGFEERGLISRRPSASDGRQVILTLAEAGRTLFAMIDASSRREIAGMLARLSSAGQSRLIAALRTAETLLGGAPPEPDPGYVLRPPKSGDLGWVVHRHGALYAAEYGWDATFEGLVAKVAANFIKSFDAGRDRCWIAERDAAIVGSVFLVRHTDQVAKLRLLYVEPDARGLGIGRRLTQECIDAARAAGYRTLSLWTNDVLIAARRIYKAEGFRMVSSEPHHSFGKHLIGETWSLEL
ncbi:MAG TPA: bifunctional helix-turn-helix transcriptional regulator/GNAT family N-acetyltransferase [Acetobacteraceae bacterium]|nr:bifunctional helix-turn-helix transcriptional regulator/GNAT family N-acetyltransferase [Acetobacteraceae bacterium]